MRPRRSRRCRATASASPAGRSTARSRRRTPRRSKPSWSRSARRTGTPPWRRRSPRSSAGSSAARRRAPVEQLPAPVELEPPDRPQRRRVELDQEPRVALDEDALPVRRDEAGTGRERLVDAVRLPVAVHEEARPGGLRDEDHTTVLARAHHDAVGVVQGREPPAARAVQIHVDREHAVAERAYGREPADPPPLGGEPPPGLVDDAPPVATEEQQTVARLRERARGQRPRPAAEPPEAPGAVGPLAEHEAVGCDAPPVPPRR